jgi:outer membrane biosynthesis protein TonB
MRQPRALDRREFSVEAALLMLSGVAVTISACGGSSESPGDPSAGMTPTPQPTPTPQATPTPEPTPTPDPYTEPQPAPTPRPSPTPTPVADRNGSISSNHGHVARITGAQLTAGGALSLDITGSATHSHTVEVSAAEVMAIARGQQVSKTSSTDASHSHVVTFN